MKWLSRVTIAALVAAVCLEVSLRAIFGLGAPLLTQRDPAAGYIAAPNQHVRRFFNDISINSDGMRSDELPAVKDGARILITGDSVTFGTTYVDQTCIFTSLIQRDLRRSGNAVTVLNVSMAGWAPTNELGYLKSRGTFGADIVLVVLNTEDLLQPFTPFDPKLSGPTSEPSSAISELFGRYLMPLIFKSLRQHDPGSSLIAADYPITEESNVLATLGEMRTLAVTHGARFGVVFSPSANPLTEKDEQAWQAVIEVFRNWVAANGITIIDLTPDYATYRAAEVYLSGVHLRPLGHRLVASAVERALEPIHASNEGDKLAIATGN